jgi:uncharacterized protein (DUF1499 family)
VCPPFYIAAVANDQTVVNPAAGRRISSLVLSLGLLAPISAAAGAILANLRIVEPLSGFVGIFVGVLLAVVAVVMWIVALVLTRKGRNPSARRRASIGVGLAVLYFAALVGLTLPTFDLPGINDITTDPTDPPEYVAIANLDANRGRDMSYDASFESQQRAGYPALAPKILDRDVLDAFVMTDRAISGLPKVEIIASVPEEGRIEATVESGIFHFVDDIVVRVKEHPRGAIIDIRSKSRDGKGDLGANAARIGAVFLALR